jgi:hypothetical protein
VCRRQEGVSKDEQRLQRQGHFTLRRKSGQYIMLTYYVIKPKTYMNDQKSDAAYL